MARVGRDDGRPDSYGPRWARAASKRSLERAGVSWTVEALRADGHDVRDCWSPDDERERHPERRRRPDGMCLVDGVPTAIEHTMFMTDPRGKEWAERWRADPTDTLGLLAVADRRTPAEFDAFLDATIASKGDQHAEWGRGILCVTHNWDQPPSLLREAINRRGVVPWWRVYWIDRAPPPILVWESVNLGA